jgi:hypothetical protein
MLIATFGGAIAFVVTLLFSPEMRGKESVLQLTLVEQPAVMARAAVFRTAAARKARPDRTAHDQVAHLSRTCSALRTIFFKDRSPHTSWC